MLYPWDPHPKITTTELDWSWKFNQDPFIPSKVTQLFNLDRQTDGQTDTHPSIHTYRQTNRQTHRQTDTCPPIHIQTGEFFIALFDTNHFTTFLKDNLEQYKKKIKLLKKIFYCCKRKILQLYLDTKKPQNFQLLGPLMQIFTFTVVNLLHVC